MNFLYRVYGLGIQSPVCLSGLNPIPFFDNSQQIIFENGLEPEWYRIAQILPRKLISPRSAETEPEDSPVILHEYGNAVCYELIYAEGAKFAVDGQVGRVWGSVQSPLTVEDLGTFLLGPVLGFVLRKRRVTALHASAVELQGKAVVFSGDAGFGKSTTAAALGLRGMPVIAEDIVPLKESSGTFLAVSGYPRVCLWPDSVAKLLGDEKVLPGLTPTWEKRFLPLDGVRAKFFDGESPLGLIYLFGPRAEEAHAPRVETLTRREALLELVKNTYMSWLPGAEERAAEFDTLCRIVEQVPVRRIVPHADADKIEDLCQLIQRDAGETLAGE